jgi:Gram-negative bacterial TonB protein C-terminal
MISPVMKKLLFAASIFIAFAPSVYAKTDPAAQQLLDKVHPWQSFFQSVSGPLELDADFTARAGNASLPGHLQLLWQSKRQWRSSIEWGGFKQIRIRNGEMEYTSRNLGYTPIAADNLLSLLYTGAASTSKLTVEKEKFQTKNGVSVICLKTRDEGSFKQFHEFCIDAALHDALTEEWQDYADHHVEFSNYVDFQGHRYPTHFEELVNAGPLFSATITKLKSAPLDADYLVPPKDAIERRKCEGMRPPIPVTKFIPDFVPGPHPQSNDTGIFSVAVLADGSVGSVEAILTGGKVLDSAVIAALKKAKFKPAMCGNQPVVADITVEMNFNSY